MSIAPKLCGCRVNMTYFINNHKIFMAYFKNEEKTPWKRRLIVNVTIVMYFFF